MTQPDTNTTTPARSITNVEGVLVGHAHDTEALTGCTVVVTPAGSVGGVDVRGGGPGTRETDLLNPTTNVSQVHAVALCGGSAFGLAAATGVVDWLREHHIGYQTPLIRVPIVPAAVIFDVSIGRSDRWADATMGYAACAAASTTTAEGCVGVGIGATVGKVLGWQAAMKGGVGTWSETLPDGTVIGALAVCNAFGDVVDEGRILAGARNVQEGGFANTMHMLRQEETLKMFQERQRAHHTNTSEIGNTTLGVVATTARLTKAEATKLAQMAQDALPRVIRPVHTPVDGDCVFALSTGQRLAPPMMILGSVAADVLARAIQRAVTEAVPLGGLPAARDLS